MRILAINTGSSTVKFSVFAMDSGTECFASEIERASSISDAVANIPLLLKKAMQHEFDAIGHRVAHGGEKLKESCVIDDAVLEQIEACVPLAPLHNPSIIEGIKMALQTWHVPQVAVFDTAFHQNMPEYATNYAVPELWRKNGVRRYGFHGISHRYIMEHIAGEMQIPAEKLRIISCHLGNGASICAIKNGHSVDTSMGMTPLEGLVMGTRSGDVDPGIFKYLSDKLGLTINQIEHALYHESGLVGLSGIGNDMRDIEAQAKAGNSSAQLAIEIYSYRVKKYIGAYAAAMGGVEAIAFTAGVGENVSYIREQICTGLEFMGVQFDVKQNAEVKLTGLKVQHLHNNDSKVKVFVTHACEQLLIARDTMRVACNL